MTPACIYVDNDGKHHIVSQMAVADDGQPRHVEMAKALLAGSDAQGNIKYIKATVFKYDQQD